jgi:monofunctional glycosyltransferase
MATRVKRSTKSRPRARTGKRKLLKRAFMGAAVCVAGGLVLSVVSTLALRWVHPWTSGLMIEKRVAAWRQSKRYDTRYQWVDWARISPHAPLAVLASEDQRFPEHHGFDFDSIQSAIDDHEKGGRLRGASTISQQVAKNVFLWSGRSFVRKGLEAYFTVLIEFLWPKRRILEVYLNVAEMGDGVFGVEAASQRFFRKSAARLSPAEAALLAAVLPNPVRFRADRPSAYVEERRAFILQQMELMGGTTFLKRLP